MRRNKCNLTTTERALALLRFPRLPQKTEWEIAHRLFTQYLFYKSENYGKRRRCWCTNCQSEFTVDRPERSSGSDSDFWAGEHKTTCLCPNCLAPVTMYQAGRIQSGNSLISFERFVALTNREDLTPGGLYVIAAECWLRYDRRNLESPTLILNEQRLYFFSARFRQEWRWAYTCQDGKWHPGFVPTVNVTEPFQCQCNYYWKRPIEPHQYYLFGVEELRRSPLRWCGYLNWKDVKDGEAASGLLRYLSEYQRRPFLEMLAKMRQREVLDALILEGDTNRERLDWKAKTPEAFFRLNKHDFKAYLKAGGQISDLKHWNDIPQKRRPELEKFLHDAKIIGGTQNVNRFADLLKKYNLKQEQALRYLERQEESGMRTQGILECWRDYLSAAEQLGEKVWRNSIRFPADLGEAHTEMTQREHEVRFAAQAAEKQEKMRIKLEEYLERKKQLEQKYCFSKDGLQIVVPKDGDEIVREGRLLKSCVGGYAERHLTGKVTILFLRHEDKPNEPYLTIEMNDSILVQIHGYDNEGLYTTRGRYAPDPRETQKAFLDPWLAWLKAGSLRDDSGKPTMKKQQRIEVQIA